MTDLYEVLGVPKKASLADIKLAYKLKAQKMHPDKGGDESSFQMLQQAYSILKNPEKRQQYDLTGDLDSENRPSEDQEAVSTILQGFQQWVQAVLNNQKRYNSDCIGEIQAAIEASVSQGKIAQREVFSKIQTMDKMCGRFKTENKKENFLEGQLSQVKKKLELDHKEITRRLGVTQKALDILKKCEYIPEGGIVLPSQFIKYHTPFSTGSVTGTT